MNRMSASAPSRFWKKVNKNGALPAHTELGCCWEWTGALWQTEKAKHLWYGKVRFDNKIVSAHRLVWFLQTGEWPLVCVLHRCDNPTCVRFSHLFLGTKGENNTDRARKGRSGNQRLSAADVLAIRESGKSTNQLASSYDVDYAHIWQIRAGINRKEG